MLMIATWDSPNCARVVVAKQPKTAKNVTTQAFWSFILDCIYLVNKKKGAEMGENGCSILCLFVVLR